MDISAADGIGIATSAHREVSGSGTEMTAELNKKSWFDLDCRRCVFAFEMVKFISIHISDLSEVMSNNRPLVK